MTNHKHKNHYKELSKRQKIFFYVWASSIILFFLSFILYLFTFSFVLGAISIFALASSTIFLYLLLINKNSSEIKKLLDLHSQKRDLILKREAITKAFFEHMITEDKYKKTIADLDEKIFNIDFKIKTFDEHNTSEKETLLKRKRLLYDLFFKKEISKELYDKLNFEIKKELIYYDVDTKNKKKK